MSASPSADPRPGLIQPDELEQASRLAKRLLAELDRLLLGRADLHRMVVTGILGRGHILLEGVPGVGKTALVKALGQILDLDFKRVQFTPDLMPGDILGCHILEETGDGKREMVFRPGPVFTHLLLADEINRASPKTQSALLEAMQEHSVTLLGTTRKLPEPFFVLASQNPIELEGTYPLPEAQLDRFLFKLAVPGLDADILDRIIATRRHGEPPAPGWRMTRPELELLYACADRIFLPAAVSRYISRLVAATHAGASESVEEVGRFVSYGASPRAAIAMAEAARGVALVAGRPTAGFDDVKAVAAAVLNHRLILNYAARLERVTPYAIIDRLLSRLDEAGLDLPADFEVAT